MSTWVPKTRPWIVCAANRLEADGSLVLGARHWDNLMRQTMEARFGEDWHKRIKHGEAEQGFIDQFGRFYTREEAMKVARSNNQLIDSEENMLSLTALHSEDLY